jgi:hypothetical protein
MANPKPQLERLLQAAEDGALFVVEVPGFDSLLNNNRFDQVFHQHIQYFSVASFLRMLNEVGGTYLAHTFNYDYWGGTMLVAFRKTAKLPQYSLPKSVRPPTTVVVEKSYENFQQQIMNLMASLESLRSEAIYGYGAAQMVPTLAYHMHSDLSFLTSILDDNPDRCGLTYPGLKVTIQPRKDELDLKDASVIVTALDSARPIMRRLLELRPRQILIPLNIL